MKPLLRLTVFLFLQGFVFLAHSQTNDLVYNLGASGGNVIVNSIATDANNNIFIGGSFNGSNIDFNPLGGTAVNLTSFGEDGFIAKYNSSGILQKACRIGPNTSSTLSDKVTSITCDPNGNIVIAVQTNTPTLVSTNNLVGSTPTPTFLIGGPGIVIIKYDNSLVTSITNSFRISSSPAAICGKVSDITSDANSFYITGSLENSNINFNSKGTAINLSSSGSQDVFVAKYSTATLIADFAYSIGSTFSDEGFGIDTDNSGNIYVTGIFRGTSVDFSPASGMAGDNTLTEFGSPGSGDVFVAKYSSSFAHQWSFSLGTALEDRGTDIAVNKTSGDLYVSGYLRTDGANAFDFNPGAATANYTPLGNNDGFVASYSTAGAYAWHKTIAQSGDDRISGITLDASNTIWATGQVEGSSINLGNTLTVNSAGSSDGIVVQYSSTGTTTIGFTVGGTSAESANTIAFATSGKVHIAGTMAGSGDYDPGAGTANLTIKGVTDGWVSRYQLCASPTITTPPTGSTVCQGSTATFSVSATNATGYQWTLGGVDISGATNAAYSITNAAPANNGSYAVRVSNACTSVTSSAVSLSVTPTLTSGSIGSNQTLCFGTTATALTELSAVTGGSGGITYQWQSSPDGSAWLSISGATSTTFAPGVVTVTTHYRRLASSGACLNVASNAVIITITPTTTAGTVGSAQTICSGSTPTAFSSLSAPSGGNGTYSFQWQSSLNGVTFSDISGATSSTYSSGALSASTHFRRSVTSGACSNVTSPSFLVTVTATVNPGVIASNQTVCTGTDVTPFSETTPASGGTGTFTYQWQQALVSTGPWSNISGATSTTYDAGVLTSTTYFKRLVSSGACSNIESAVLTITVTPVLTPGSIAGNQTICSGEVPTTITSTTLPSGGTGSYTYAWEQSTNGGTSYTTISGVTSTTYAPVGLVTTALFRRMATSGGCMATSAPITIMVTPALNAGAVTGDRNLCAGSTIPTLTESIAPSGGSGSFSYSWEQSFNAGVSYAVISGATQSSYSPGTAGASVLYRRVVSSASCTATSAAVTINVTPTTLAGTISGDESICAGATAASIASTVTASGGNGSFAYQWQSSLNGSSWSAISGATSTTYAPGVLTVTTHYRRLTSSQYCTNIASNVVIKTVTPTLDPGVIGVNQSICSSELPDPLTSVTAPTGGNSIFSYQWETSSNGTVWSTISGATAATYAPALLSSTTHYRRSVSSGACLNQVSNTVIITVTPSVTPTISATATQTTVCSATSITFNASITNGGTTPAYQWLQNNNPISGATNASYSTASYTTGDNFSVRLTSNANCATTATVTSSALTITVTSVVVPSISITPSTSSICQGTSVTFTATPVNGGPTPQYQWRLNGNPIAGATNSSYTSNSIVTSDVFSVVLTSNAPCVQAPGTAISSGVSITVNPLVTPSVVISPGSSTICSNQTLNFTATPTHPGTAPSYQWKKNGIDISGATLSTYSESSVATNDQFSVVMQSNASCTTSSSATSAVSTITVTTAQTPSVTISVPALTNCAGATVVFTATPINGGIPQYQWRINGSNVGSASTASTYSTTTLADGDVVSVVMTTSLTCVTATTDVSNQLPMVVLSIDTPEVTITANQTSVCSGGSVQFSSSTTGGGSAPTYQWFKNNVSIPGATSDSYEAFSIVSNDAFKVELTSSATCKTTATDQSNSITITTTSSTVASVALDVQPGTTAYLGQNVVFTAIPSSGGSTPTYVWRKNSTIIPSATSSLYSTNSLINGDVIQVTMTSSLSCATGSPASTSVTMSIQANPSFSSSISGPGSVTANQQNVTFNVPNQTGMTYQWTVPPGATIISGQGTSSVTIDFGSTGGTVSVIETNPAGQTNVLNLPIGIATSIQLSQLANRVSVYPIPVVSQLTIELQWASSANLQVFTSTGESIDTFVWSDTTIPFTLVFPYASGVYLLRIDTPEGVVYKKIVKE
ncbi:MAG: T9SS type A sorting domain-containing protein [Cytophagaceae bacterium]|nr:T9SS type A sorting domain-containing protein [Cytophagaceae bacterium]